MRGMLSFMVLFLLSKRSMYGQEIAEEIGRRKGEKPNPGTIYPALKDLSAKGLVDVKRDGRRTVYDLTRDGRKVFNQARELFIKAYADVIDSGMV